jgi:hypothetical protein
MRLEDNIKILNQETTCSELEKVLCNIGVTKSKSVSYGRNIESSIPNGGLYQEPRQLAEFLTFISRFTISSFVNIGTFNGWTVSFMVAYLRLFNNHISCISIDPYPQFLSSELPDLGILFHHGTSESLKGLRSDLVFIDGDHSAKWVMKDYKNIGKHSKLCAFHDVNDKHCGSVRNFYDNLCKSFNHKEFLYHPNGGKSMGIGVVSRDCLDRFYL